MPLLPLVTTVAPLSKEQLFQTPAWMERLAPEPLDLVQHFVNTHAYSGRADALADITTARRVLRSHLQPVSALDEPWLKRLRGLREAVRIELLAHGGHADPESAGVTLRRGLRRLAPALAFDPNGRPSLTGTGTGTERFVGNLVAAIATAELTGTWVRLKACGLDECHVAFWDTTKNGSARYCSATGCANLARQRSFRVRHPQ